MLQASTESSIYKQTDGDTFDYQLGVNLTDLSYIFGYNSVASNSYGSYIKYKNFISNNTHVKKLSILI